LNSKEIEYFSDKPASRYALVIVETCEHAMANSQNEVAFDMEVVTKASERWETTANEREQAARNISKGRYDLADTPERLMKRIHRITEKVKEAAIGEELPEAIAEANELAVRSFTEEESAEIPISDVELNALYERVIGESRDFLGVDFLTNGIRASRSVARIVTSLPSNRKSFGTGFLVTPNLLLTNNHVLPRKQTAEQSVAEFNFEARAALTDQKIQTYQLLPNQFFLTNKKLDYSLVAVAKVSSEGTALQTQGHLPLIQEQGKINIGNPVNIVQHPMGRTKEVVIRENKLAHLLDDFAHYLADTEPGSSGSPVFNDEWEVVALHHSGVPKRNSQGEILRKDNKVWRQNVDSPETIDWIGNEGVRISTIVKNIAGTTVEEHEKALQREFVAISQAAARPSAPDESQQTPRPSDLVDVSSRRSVTAMQSLHNGSVSITVPLTITVSLGQPDQASDIRAPLDFGPDMDERGQARVPKPNMNFDDRKGFNTQFLGRDLSTPMPTPEQRYRQSLLDVSGKPGTNGLELKYYTYSIIMHSTRRIAVVSAVNYFANAPARDTGERKDKWYVDPRVGAARQSQESFYQDPLIDRGHLTRRADAAWGKNVKEAQASNDDTFFFTNCSQQHSGFNQSSRDRAKDLWGSLENHIAEQARNSGGKLCVYNGPILASSDPELDGLKVPLQFYKVIAYKKDNGKLSALAFVLSQEELISKILRNRRAGRPREAFEEDFDPGAFKLKQKTIKDVERATRLVFGNLSQFDAMELDEGFNELAAEGISESTIESLEDIVL
jgi:endonuclease G, mitochondrial